MTDIMKIGLSALLAQQRALAATSNNIANANTDGYSRQRVELASRETERLGTAFVGTGVYAGSVRRLGDEILADQLRLASAAFHRSESFASLAAALDNLLADQNTGLNNALQTFVNALQNVADDPSSSSARQVFLSEARNLVSRFNSLDHRLDEIGADVNAKITAAAAEITSLGTNIADVNRQILASGVPAGGAPPPDLLDQRDRLLARLSELVEVHTVAQSDGTMGVFIGSGQVLVLGTQSAELDVTQSASSPEELDVVLRGNGPDVTITRFLSGGALGGALDFRREMLAPARAGLGRIAAGLATTANALHRNGMDFNGALGADLFSVPPPEALAADANAGTGTVAVALADLGGLEATRYELTYDGAGYTLTRTDTGAAVPLTGSGTALDPLQADGLSMVVAGAPVAGDRFLIRTVDQVPSGLALMLADPAAVAAAAPTLTRAALANTGAAQISAGTVIDATDPNLLATATIEFLDPATYSIDGAGAFAYTAGADIDVNGTRVRITGVPAAGDQFTIEANTGGIGDNRNALALLDGLASGVLDGGAVTLQGAVAQLVTRVGVQTAETNNRRDAQALVLDQTRTALDSVRGINLDEEAGDMLRYEQAYQAAAKTIAVADGLFSSLLNALRGG